MTDETIAAKAGRYLTEGRLTVLAVNGDHVTAVCYGGHDAIYQLGHDPGRGWHCSCPVRSGRCSHLTALQMVTVRAREPAEPAPVQRARLLAASAPEDSVRRRAAELVATVLTQIPASAAAGVIERTRDPHVRAQALAILGQIATERRTA
jgi:uncharacterized Zn finger protein